MQIREDDRSSAEQRLSDVIFSSYWKLRRLNLGRRIDDKRYSRSEVFPFCSKCLIGSEEKKSPWPVGSAGLSARYPKRAFAPVTRNPLPITRSHQFMDCDWRSGAGTTRNQTFFRRVESRLSALHLSTKLILFFTWAGH